MTHNTLATDRGGSSTASLLRGSWPVPVFIALALVAQQLVLSARYDVGGHAAEHLAGASVPFMAAAMLAILLWASRQARRQADVLLAGAAWFVAALAVMFGNLRVVDDLVAAGYSDTPTSSVPDIADHGLANASIWYAEATALLLIAVWRRRRHVGNRATLGAVVTTLVVPPWIVPGAGVIVLAFVAYVQRCRCKDSRQP